MLQTIAFAAIALFTTGVVGAVIRPFLQREGITLTRAGVSVLTLVICGSSAGISAALFPELPEITASEPVVVVEQEKAQTITKADILAARATRLANEARERAYRVGQRSASDRFASQQIRNNYYASVQEDTKLLKDKIQRVKNRIKINQDYGKTVLKAHNLLILDRDGSEGPLYQP